jgi:hypothetical protein
MPCRRSEAGRGTCELVHFWVSQKRCNLHFFLVVQGFPSAKLDSWGMFRVVVVNPKMITDPLLEESSSEKCV